jgi:hypothetical protein
MKTPIQKLIKTFEEMRSPVDNDVDVDFAISLMRSMLDEEKNAMCEFADEFAIECINFYHEKTISEEEFFDLTFNTNDDLIDIEHNEK